LEIIYAIPGLGTTRELFCDIVISNYEIKVLEWPEPKSTYTLKEYAGLFLEQINVARPVTLMGVSFGGMICSELAEQVRTNKVILISSCKDVSEFPFLLKFLRIIPLHRLMPDAFVKWVSKRRMNSTHRLAPIFKMMYSMKKNYFYNTINYIVKWDKKESKQNFIRIHGTADRLLPNNSGKNFNYINGGSHAMIFTRPKEINAILNKELNGL